MRVVDLVAKSKHLAGLLGDSDGVTSKRLDRDTERLGLSNGAAVSEREGRTWKADQEASIDRQCS